MKPHEMVKNNPMAKYIFIARNAKDCVVSFFHHTRGFPQHYDFEGGDFDVFFELFVEGKVDFGSYYHMTRSWFEHRHDDNILFLTYENIISHKEESLLQIADFISNDLVQKLKETDNELMEKILLHSSVQSMQKDPLRWCSERKAKFTPFIRKGQSGSWNELLTDEQVQRLDNMTRKYFTETELQELGDKY